MQHVQQISHNPSDNLRLDSLFLFPRSRSLIRLLRVFIFGKVGERNLPFEKFKSFLAISLTNYVY